MSAGSRAGENSATRIMSFFRYQAVDQTGKVVNGTMDAPTEAHVSARLAQMGYRPQAVMPAPSAAQNAAAPQLPTTQSSSLGGVSARQLAIFFRQFAALARSGINLYQTMETLGPRAGHPALVASSKEMAEAARTGGRISDVMERYPRVYASHVTAGVRAGETGGFLDIILDEIALDYEQDVAFYKGFAVPRAIILQGLAALAIGQPVFPYLFPPPSRWGTYFQLVFLRNIPILLAGMAVSWMVYRRMQEPENRDSRDRLALRIPVFGDLARQKALASFVRTLRKLFAAGVGPITAWEGAMKVAPNAVIRDKLTEAYDMMQHGVALHDAFSATGLFANETEQLLATGVLSGQMVQMLDRVAEYYQDNVDRAYSSARFWMFRLAFTSTIILLGALVIMLMSSYFSSVFNWVDDFMPEASS